MDLKITYDIKQKSELYFKENYEKVDNAIDYLWSDKDAENAWVKKPMQIHDDEIEEIMMTAIAAQDTCGLFVVIGQSSDFIAAKSVIDAIGTKLGTAPEMIFLDEALSSVKIRQALEKMRHYEINGCVICRDGNRKETLATYGVFRQYMQNRYGKEIAPRRIMIITESEDSILTDLAKADGSGIFNFFSQEDTYYNVLSPISLFIMAVAGVEIKRFISGCEVMATDSFWDIDGGNLPILIKHIKESLFYICFKQKNFKEFCRWTSLLLSDADKQEVFILADKSVDDFKLLNEFNKEKEAFYLEISAEQIEENIYLEKDIANSVGFDNINEIKNILLKEDNVEKLENKVGVTIEISDAFNLGQLTYYFMMISSILKGM